MEIKIARSNDIYYNAINPSECLLLKCYVISTKKFFPPFRNKIDCYSYMHDETEIYSIQ